MREDDKTISISGRKIGTGNPCFIIAEMSGNHNMDFSRAEAIIRAAADAGVDAVKLQTYTADTITLNSDKECFMTEEGGLWSGQTLYDLYKQAYTPWEWQPKLKKLADELGLFLFSSPFDCSAVDFLEEMQVPAHKIASFEITDTILLKRVARTGKPILISTGIAGIGEIQDAIEVCKSEGNDKIILLKCTSSYPAPYGEMNLRTMVNMGDTFGCPIGLSDHSMGDEIAVAAVAMGASVIEKHFTLQRSDGGVDSAFSMEASEMKDMVRRIRNVELALGDVSYSLTQGQQNERRYGRSLFVTREMKKGETFTEETIRSVRPSNGLEVKYYDEIIGKKASRDLEFAKPLEWADISQNID